MTVSFLLDKQAFACYDPEHGDWFVESGKFIVEIGKSSREICLSHCVQVEGGAETVFPVTANTTLGQLKKHARGHAILEKLLSGGSTSDASAMGEGGGGMMRRMMMEMPLNALVSYGRMTAKQLHDMIRTLNS